MTTKIYLAVIGSALLTAGCVPTVTGSSAGGVPFLSDKLEGRYERSPDEVQKAAKAVISYMGTLVSEGIIHDQTNDVRTVVGKVNQRNVWVRAEAIDPKVTAVTVQARTKGGGVDQPLVHEIEKQIALKLVH